MAGLYLDASVLLPTLLEQASSADVDAFILGSSDPLIVSDFATAEVSNGTQSGPPIGA